MLQEVGFWCHAGGADAAPDRPDPTRLVDDAWADALLADSERARVLQQSLTTSAFVESHELAYSYCRFPDCYVAQREPKVMGACTLTDGVFCWPEGLWHYVSCHHVRLPAAFLEHMDASRERMEMERAAEARGRLLLWDTVEQAAVAMPVAMHEWIVAYTTLQIPHSSELDE